MMFDVQFKTEGEAFDTPNKANFEIVNILGIIARKVSSGSDGGPIRDSNGNTIGSWYKS